MRLEALAHRGDPVDRQQAVQRLIVELGADNKRDGIVRTSRDHATQHGRKGDFERWGGYAPDGCVGWIAPCPLLQRCRDVVAIEPATPPIREGRRHRPTNRIEEAPGQRGIRLLLTIRCPAAGVRVEACLDSLEETGIDDGLVPAGMRPPLFILDKGPDNPSHFVAVQLDDGILHLDLIHPCLPPVVSRSCVIAALRPSVLELLGKGGRTRVRSRCDGRQNLAHLFDDAKVLRRAGHLPALPPPAPERRGAVPREPEPVQPQTSTPPTSNPGAARRRTPSQPPRYFQTSPDRRLGRVASISSLRPFDVGSTSPVQLV